MSHTERSTHVNCVIRLKITVDDLQEAAVALVKAMELREKYMKASLQKNGRVLNRYLKLARLGSQEGLRPPKKTCIYAPQPSTRGNSTFFSIINFISNASD